MIYNFFITFKFHRFLQSGGYLDYFYKKFSEVFIRNIFVYASQFIGEKYMIEILTKKIIDNSIFVFNRYIGWDNLKYFNFFFNFLVVLFYSIFLINLIIILI